MKKSLTLLLSLAPGRLHGALVETTEGRDRPVRFLSRRFEDSVPAPDSFRDFLRELHGSEEGTGRALLALHPSWIAASRTAIPPGRPAEVREFLALAVERGWPREEYGATRFSWTLSSDSPREALLFVVRERLLSPLEEALSETGWPLEHITHGALLRSAVSCSGERTEACLYADDEGVSLVRQEGSRVAGAAWIPADLSMIEVAAPLVEFHLGQHLAGHTGVIHLCGSEGEKLSKYLKLPGDVRRTSARATLGADWVAQADEEEAEARALLLALLKEAGARGPRVDFSPPRESEPEWSTRLSLAMNDRRMPRLAAAMGVALLVVLLGGWVLQSSLQASAKEIARSITIDETGAGINIEILRTLESRRRPFLDYLTDLRTAKEGVTIERFDIDSRNNVTIAGRCSSFAAVEAFAVKLNESRSFNGAVTQSTARINDREVSFTIRCRVGAGR